MVELLRHSRDKECVGISAWCWETAPLRWCHSTYEDRVMGKESSCRVVEGTMETRRKVNELKEEAGSTKGRGSSKIRRKVLDEIEFLLSEKSMEEWQSFLEEMRGSGGVAAEDSYSILTFGSL